MREYSRYVHAAYYYSNHLTSGGWRSFSINVATKSFPRIEEASSFLSIDVSPSCSPRFQSVPMASDVFVRPAPVLWPLVVWDEQSSKALRICGWSLCSKPAATNAFLHSVVNTWSSLFNETTCASALRWAKECSISRTCIKCRLTLMCSYYACTYSFLANPRCPHFANSLNWDMMLLCHWFV